MKNRFNSTDWTTYILAPIDSSTHCSNVFLFQGRKVKLLSINGGDEERWTVSIYTRQANDLEAIAYYGLTSEK